jgi:hypothetical protein
MVDEAQVVFDLGVAEVVPVARVSGIEVLKEVGEIALGGNGFVILAVFDAELHTALASMGYSFAKELQDPRVVNIRNFLARLNGIEFSFHKFTRVNFSLLHHLAQRDCEIQGADAAGVHHDKRRAEFFSPVDGGKGEPQGAVAVLGAVGSELVTIR